MDEHAAPRWIRLARSHDLAVLREIEAEGDALFEPLLGPEPFGPDATTDGADRAAQPGFLLVAVPTEGAAPIGFAHVLHLEEHAAHLEQVAVRTAHLRRGHGRALVEASLAEAARRGRPRMTLRTYDAVPWNRPFYEACGFRVTAPSPEHRELIRLEEEHGLLRHGERVLMARDA